MIDWLRSNIHKDWQSLRSLYPKKEIPEIPEQLRKSEAELFLESLPSDHRQKGHKLLMDLYDVNIISDPTIYGHKMAEFRDFITTAYSLKESTKSGIPLGRGMNSGSSDLYGFKPSGTQLWSYFVNPFEVYAYVAQHHKTVKMCLNMIREAMEEDGFFLVAAEGVPESYLMEVYKKLNDLDIEDRRMDIASHLKVYGNAWLRPVRSRRVSGLKSLDLLYPGKLFPDFDKRTDEILRYIYIKGQQKFEYSPEQLLHVKLPSIEVGALGSPPLTSAIPMIETSFHAQNFNLTWFYKGGLIGHILAVEQPDSGPFSQNQSADWVQSVQDQLNYLYSGSTAGGGIAAFSNVSGVHKITDTATMDASWREGDRMTAKTVSMLLGVPPEKIGVPRNESAQYQAELVENVINADFDRTMNSLTKRTDKFLNMIIKRYLGFKGVKIQSSGRYGAMTLNAAKTITELSKAGPLITVNQALDRVLGWEPLPADEERGRQVLDTSSLRTTKEGESIIPPVYAPTREDPDLQDNLDKILGARDKIERSLRMQMGGADDGKLFKPKD